MSTDQIKNKSASIRDKLYNISKSSGIEFNNLIILYMQERILYRLCQSSYHDKFVLKGGLLLFAYYGFHGRPTQDIDLLGKNMSNDIDYIGKVFKEIPSQDYHDGLSFSTDTIIIENITENAKYPGVRVKINCLLGNARNIMSIDIGFGDVVTPKPLKMQFPCILESEPIPEIYTYTKESIIAEKFHAMIKLGTLNSRMKDFCDIYMLSLKNDFEGAVLSEAMKETFEKRNTGFEKNPIVFSDEFKKNKDKRIQWTAFLKRAKLQDIPSDFEEVLSQVETFIYPVYEKLLTEDDFIESWSHEQNLWKR